MSGKPMNVRMHATQVEAVTAAAEQAKANRNTWVLAVLRTLIAKPPPPRRSRKDAPDPVEPSERGANYDGHLPLRIPPDVLAGIDRVRGAATRHSWIRWATQHALAEQAASSRSTPNA